MSLSTLEDMNGSLVQKCPLPLLRSEQFPEMRFIDYAGDDLTLLLKTD